MKKTFVSAFSILFVTSIFAQSKDLAPNCYLNYEEFLHNRPSLTITFQLKKRTDGDIFMTGGIANYRLKKIKPESFIEKVETEFWGVKVDDSVYINSFPYSRIKGFNKIIEIGYYSYFIGEPARTEKEQIELGIIKPNEKQIGVCCKVGYVILPDGIIKLLRPELLLELCEDNDVLSKEIKVANLKLEDVIQMFDILKRYNLIKKTYR